MEKEKDTNIAIGQIESVETENGPILKSQDTGFIETMYFTRFYDEKEYKRFINNIIRTVRTSKEYNNYIKLLRTNISSLNTDVILSNITTDDADIEFHHYPFSIYDIVDIVITQNLLDGKKISSLSVASEVLELHYKHYIGIVPLTKLNHDLAHAGEIFINKHQVFGNYQEFIKRYDKAILPVHRQALDELEKLSEEQVASDIGGLYK